MGDVNQILFIQRRLAQLQGPYLEVGSKDYGSTQDLRRRVAGGEDYVGVDMEEGSGVDLVVDLTAPFEQVAAALGGARFGTIFCLSVLEHCRQPFAMADNLTRLLVPGGKICISVPFAWKFHGYPSDYWRFTHEGVKTLFPDLTFDEADAACATCRPGELARVDEHLGRIPFSFTAHRRRGHYLRAVAAKGLKLLGKVGLLRWLAGYPYVLAPTNLLMIGTKKM
jgi:SAM-dependent methyltransferase